MPPAIVRAAAFAAGGAAAFSAPDLAAVSAPAAALAAAPAVDRWLLDGHGVGRALFAPSSKGSWTLKAPAKDCAPIQFYTPFSSYVVDAGMAARDAAGQAPLLAVPLSCSNKPTLWVVDPVGGTTVAFGPLPNASEIDSYAKFLPDGSVALGTSGAALSVYDPTTLDLLYANGDIAGGGGGAQVIAVTKPGPGGQPSQIQVAGGTGGPNWWGAAGDLPADAGAKAFPFANVQGNADSTVCMGADGRSMFNNQRFESPGGVVRFTMPFPSSPEAYK